MDLYYLPKQKDYPNLDYAHDQRFERLSTLLMLSVIE